MRKIKLFSKCFAIILIVALTMSSCMTTRTNVGKYNEKPGREYTYAEGKQFWVFWGLFPIGRTNVATPEDGTCMVQTRLTFVDFLISGVTGGIFSSYTIKVKSKH